MYFYFNVWRAFITIERITMFQKIDFLHHTSPRVLPIELTIAAVGGILGGLLSLWVIREAEQWIKKKTRHKKTYKVYFDKEEAFIVE